MLFRLFRLFQFFGLYALASISMLFAQKRFTHSCVWKSSEVLRSIPKPNVNRGAFLLLNLALCTSFLIATIPRSLLPYLLVFACLHVVALVLKGKLKVSGLLEDWCISAYVENVLCLAVPFTLYRFFFLLVWAIGANKILFAIEWLVSFVFAVDAFDNLPLNGENVGHFILYAKVIYFCWILGNSNFYINFGEKKGLKQSRISFTIDILYSLSYGVLNSWLHCFCSLSFLPGDVFLEGSHVLSHAIFSLGAGVVFFDIIMSPLHKACHQTPFYEIFHVEHHLPRNPTILIGSDGTGFLETILGGGSYYGLAKVRAPAINLLHFLEAHLVDEFSHHYYSEEPFKTLRLFVSLPMILWNFPISLWRKVVLKLHSDPVEDTFISNYDESPHGRHHWRNDKVWATGNFLDFFGDGIYSEHAEER